MQYCVSGIEFTGSCGVHHSTWWWIAFIININAHNLSELYSLGETIVCARL